MFTSLRRWWRQKLVNDIGTWKERFVRCSECHKAHLRARKAVTCPCGSWLILEPYPKPVRVIRTTKLDVREIHELLRRAKAK